MGAARMGALVLVALIAAAFGSLLFAPTSYSIGSTGLVVGLLAGSAVLHQTGVSRIDTNEMGLAMALAGLPSVGA